MRTLLAGSRTVRTVVMLNTAGLTLALVLAAPAGGQVPAAKKAAAKGTAADGSSLARFVPREDLLSYAEFAGVESRRDAWRKTAAYKMLNETTFGAMLESLIAQGADAALAKSPDARLNGKDVVAVIKHLARFGFAVALAGKPGPQPPVGVFVLRGGARADSRGLFNKLISQLNAGGARPQSVVKAGGREVFQIQGGPGSGWAWWAEKDDLVLTFASPESTDTIISVLEGERPNAVAHPIRTELAKAEGTFQPIGLAFIDLSSLPPLPPQAQQLGLSGLKRIDLRWGLQDEAMVGILGVQAPRPRQGLLALFDQPTFDKSSLPPLPADQADFTALSIDLDKLYDQVAELAKASNPQGGDRIAALEAAFRQATGQRLREDVLAHLGPKMVYYVVPTKITAPTNFISGMVTPILQFPKGALIADVDDVAAFGKILDQLAARANEAGKSGGPRGQNGGSVEFRKLQGPNKGYVAVVPPGVLPLPAGLRPTIALGKSHVVIAATPDVARQALSLESQPAGQRRSGALGQTIDRLPGHLLYLSVSDPRDSLSPEVLANLPLIVQAFGSLATSQNAGRPQFRPGPRFPLPQGDFQLQMDPDLIPSPDALRKYFFPGSFSVAADDQGIRFVSREAFPSPTALVASPVATPAVMIALLLPATQSAREAARRAQCTNNLKQIGLAFHNFHSTNDKFPAAAIVDKAGKPLLSWRVAILPYVEQQNLYNQFHLDEPWDSPHNKELIQSMPAVYACPTRNVKDGTTTYRVFVGKDTAFEHKEGDGIASFTDGTSNTILVAESTKAEIWTKPDELKFDANPGAHLIGKTVHPGGFNTLFADGSVRFLKNSINMVVLKALITRDGGEVISADSF